VLYHHGVDSRIDEHEHPNRRGHETHASPHGQHSTSVVVLLQGGAALAFGQDNGCVEDLVELGKVEPPPPERKTFIPDSAHVHGIWQASVAHENVRVEARPSAIVGVVSDGVPEASWAVDLAQRINGTHDCVRLAVVRKRVLQASNHGHTGDGRVDGQEHVVEDDKSVKRPRLRDSPGLVAVLAVVPVDKGNGDEVDAGNAQWDLVGQRALVEVFRNRERVGKGRLAVPWRRDGEGCGIWRKLEDGSCRPVAWVERGSRARHGNVRLRETTRESGVWGA